MLPALLLAGCGAAGPVTLDIDELARSCSSAMITVPPGLDTVQFDVLVSGGALAAALDAGGEFDLKLFECKVPDGAGAVLPLYLGGTPVIGLAVSQVSSEREMLAGLSVAAPRNAVEGKQAWGRFVTRETAFGPEIVSKPVELRAN